MRVLLAGAANDVLGRTGYDRRQLHHVAAALDGRGARRAFDHPGIDFTRFNIPYWQKWERMLRFARDRDMIISVVLDISTHHAQAPAGSEDERRYIRYAVARLERVLQLSPTTWETISTASATRSGRTRRAP